MAASTSSAALSLAGAKLYYTPTSCSFGPFTIANYLGVNLNVEQVDLKTHKTHNGVDFYTVNPKGNVPALILSDGTILRENQTVLQVFADQKADNKGVLGAHGSLERYKILDAVNLVATEIHTGIGGMFGLNDGNKEHLTSRAHMKLKMLDSLLAGKQFLALDRFTIADAYAFPVIGWLHYFPTFDSSKYTNVHKYHEALKNHPAIKDAQAAAAKNPTSL